MDNSPGYPTVLFYSILLLYFGTKNSSSSTKNAKNLIKQTLQLQISKIKCSCSKLTTNSLTDHTQIHQCQVNFCCANESSCIWTPFRHEKGVCHLSWLLMRMVLVSGHVRVKWTLSVACPGTLKNCKCQKPVCSDNIFFFTKV